MKEAVGRIVAHLRRRGEPESSRALVELFLRMPVPSEELATRLLAPLLEGAGALYREGEGWVAAGPSRDPAVRFAGAVVDEATGGVVVADAEGVDPDLDEGWTIVMLDPVRQARRVRAHLRNTGRAVPPSFVSLRSAVKSAVRLPRGADPGAACAALGVRWLDSEDARGTARAMAACAAEAASRGSRPAEGETPDLVLPEGITAETLIDLPPAPGVYRFYDKEGALLYVGKAANLRRRVTSYFSRSAARRPRRFYGSIHRLEYDLAGSEAEALLKEARLIARRAPSGNVQVGVRERGRRYGRARSLALLLPRADGRGVTAIVMREGRYLGHATIGPRGGGLVSARRLIARALRAGPTKDQSGAPPDRDSEILNSWIARAGSSVSRVDLDGFARTADAVRALRDAAARLGSEPGPEVFR